MTEANGARWPSRSSKSVAPCSRGEARFDSEALPPAFAPLARRRLSRRSAQARRRTSARASARPAIRFDYLRSIVRSCEAPARSSGPGGRAEPLSFDQADIARPRAFLRFFGSEFDALTFAEQLEDRSAD